MLKLRWVQMTGRANFYLHNLWNVNVWKNVPYELIMHSSSAISHWLQFTTALGIAKYKYHKHRSSETFASFAQVLQTPFKTYLSDMLGLVSVLVLMLSLPPPLPCLVFDLLASSSSSEKSFLLSMFSCTLCIFTIFHLCMVGHQHVWMMMYLLICVVKPHLICHRHYL
jgi:hypothetical protein